jgi:exopolyphosphatase / guanosine-5'-triphosphate,3'-diphosphate pyrophosphatase
VDSNPTYGAIDLGTNTFHLLIAGINKSGELEEIHRASFYVHLAEDGIEVIGEPARQRALNALLEFKSSIEKYSVQKVRACGTAALRTASNGPELIREIKEITGFDIELISGDEEARLISKGVLQLIPAQQNPYLIMDIGGGSVEYILGQNHHILFKRSYPIGVAVLKNKFKHHQPILNEERDEIMKYLGEVCRDLKEAIEKHQPENLIGASGTFDVLANHLSHDKSEAKFTKIKPKLLSSVFEEAYSADADTLIAIDWIPTERRKLIVVAFCLIEFTLGLHAFETLFTSSYAIKEGILSEMM